MNYYHVGVSSVKYHGYEPLTYAYAQKLRTGDIVIVEMRGSSYVGIVMGATSKPPYKTKEILQHLTQIPQELVSLLEWQQAYYPAPLGVHCALVAPRYIANYSQAKPEEILAQKSTSTPQLPPLTAEQRSALLQIQKNKQRPATFIIHGRTGSGKTRLYIELIKKSLDEGKSALILSPEIGLSSQLSLTLKASLPKKTAFFVIHSAMTTRERRNAWIEINRVSRHSPVVIIGPRSALFSPISNLGLVIVDEFHDAAYKQDQSPYYHANRVASKLATLHEAVLVFGSATPPIYDLYIAKLKNVPIITMHNRAVESDKQAHITLVDMHDKQAFSNNSEISDPLVKAITIAMQNKQQSLLLLNRRGTARIILCQACDWQALCPECDLPLVFHADSYNLRCHTCSYTAKPPISCPVCSDTDIVFKSSGTKSIETITRRLFPSARIMRFDADNKKSEQLNNHIASLINADVDIIIGTQIIAKGLDLPKLGTVGVLYADSSLSFPDYSSNEITNQLITQVIGRADRGHNETNIFIQTFRPENPAVLSAVRGDWSSFYETEIQERKAYNFPPFKHALKITLNATKSEKACADAQKLAKQINAIFPTCTVSQPTPSFYGKRAGKFYWQIIIRSSRRSTLTQLIREHLPANAHYDIDPLNLL